MSFQSNVCISINEYTTLWFTTCEITRIFALNYTINPEFSRELSKKYLPIYFVHLIVQVRAYFRVILHRYVLIYK